MGIDEMEMENEWEGAEKYRDLIDKLIGYLNEGKVIKMILTNSGVHVDAKGYYLLTKVEITVDGEPVFKKIEDVSRGSSMWMSNYTGAELETMWSYVSEKLLDYCHDIADKIINEFSPDDVYYDDEGNYYLEKDGKRYCIPISEYSSSHFIGRHIFVITIRKPHLVEVI